jgi:2-polyprenyl-3-methyl-5-hydroxy-6-metoxy-1,4-benzoquinol methylase
MNLIEIVQNSSTILDVGTGPLGSYFYQYAKPETLIVGIDKYNKPKVEHKNFAYEALDALDLDKVGTGLFTKFKPDWIGYFDLVVADHVLEHVNNPATLASGIKKVLKKDGIAHIALPDPLNFTDRFYHLIHPEGGGHIAKITKEEIITMFEKLGFELLHYNDIPDDWKWLEKLYDWRRRGVKYFDEADMQYIVETFRKELTADKGYIYGGEYFWRKS